MRHKLINDGEQKTFAVTLDTGEDVMKCLTQFAQQQNLGASSITAIGAFREAMLGFFNFSTKDYNHIPAFEQTEVLVFNGNISLTEQNTIQIHAHTVLGKADGGTIGGHVLSGKVHPTLEIIITESPIHLHRRLDSKTGLQLLNF